MIVLENDETGAQTEEHQKRMMGEVAKLTAGSNGALDVAAAERTVASLLSGGSDPVITKAPEGAWTSMITDKALASKPSAFGTGGRGGILAPAISLPFRALLSPYAWEAVVRIIGWFLVVLGVAGLFWQVSRSGFAAPSGYLYGMADPAGEAAYCLAVAERIREITRETGPPRLEGMSTNRSGSGAAGQAARWPRDARRWRAMPRPPV